VAVYDTLTGQFLRGLTHQGYADESMWSRGQSWAIYGYTMVYRFTHDPVFLRFAQKVTDIYLKRLRQTSDDWVPLWDMDDPRGLEAPKDASAACVVASALLELSTYVGGTQGSAYRDAAVKMLTDLSSDRYQSGNRNVSFLLHSTGHHPAGNEIDASIIYADYYYLEALLRLKYGFGKKADEVQATPVAAASFPKQTLTLTNPTGLQRHEVVEIEHAALPSQSFIVRDAYGIEQPYQLTHDGRLLLFASIRPHGTATYTVEPGKPAPMQRFVFTRLYPERLDDIVIENDRTGYRFYGPALQRKGERGFGIDVWLKNTPQLVIDSLYRLEFSLHPEIEQLRRQGRYTEADSLTTLTSFHLNHGLGMDCYNVGPTLGCGTPALLSGDTLLFPWCYDTYTVVDDGPLRVSVQMDFAPVVHAELSEQPVTEHRLVTLDRGSNFCQMKVWYTGLDKPADVAAGFVIHEADKSSLVLGPDYIHYADPTGDAQRQNCQIYVGVLFPEGIDATRQLLFDTPANGNAGHAVGVHRALRADEPFTCYFGSAWSQYDVRSQDEWQLRVRDCLTCRRSPIGVKLSF